MDLKRVATLAVFSILLAAGFIVYFVIYLHTPITSYTINNGRDSHGCVARSGFKWDNSTQSCIKESSNGTIYQVTDYQSCLDAGYAISENNGTKQLQCQTLNGTLFIDDSPKVSANMNLSENNTTKYPDNVTLVGNFSIASLFGK